MKPILKFSCGERSVCLYPAFIKVSADNDTRLRRETARETFTLLREFYTDTCVFVSHRVLYGCIIVSLCLYHCDHCASLYLCVVVCVS